MRNHLLTLGYQLDDLHPEVGEGVPEGPDPVPGGQGYLTVGYLVKRAKVAVIDRLLNQTADKNLILFSGHDILSCRPSGSATSSCRRRRPA